MTKDVTQSTLTQSPAATKLADQVLGRIASPRTRWNPASLVASVTAAVELPLFIMLNNTFLGVAEIPGTFNFLDEAMDLDFPNFADPTGSGTLGYFQAEAGNTRSRPILPGAGSGVSVVPAVIEVNGSNYMLGFIEGILGSRPPSMTLQQLVGRCIDLLSEGTFASNYTIAIDQSAGIVVAIAMQKTAANFVTAVNASPSLTNPLIFDLAEPQDPGSEPFVQKPFWG